MGKHCLPMKGMSRLKRKKDKTRTAHFTVGIFLICLEKRGKMTANDGAGRATLSSLLWVSESCPVSQHLKVPSLGGLSVGDWTAAEA